MPKPKDKQNPDDSEIKVKPGKSSLAEFVKKPLPSEEENKEFEEMAEEEAREEAVEESLTEIYQDDKGKVDDVKKLYIKKKRGVFFWLSVFLFFILVIGTGVWAYYNIYLSHGTNPEAVDFTISAPQQVVAGEEFLYVINYKNLENIDLGNIEIKVIYPDNFIFLDSSPAPVLGSSTKNNIWRFEELNAHRSSKIQIKGKIVGPEDTENIILADMIYTPANFTSEFKRSASGETIISDIGIYFDFEVISSVLVGEDNEIIISYRARENNFLPNFRLAIEPLENMEFIKTSEDEENVHPGVWQISDIGEEEKEIKIKFKFNKKLNNYEELKLRFEHSPQISEAGEAEDREYYTFLEKSIEIEILESDLSLNLIINGSRSDQGINFGQTLNYSIVYANKGETMMKDIIIMAVMESDFLDWSSLGDENKGKVKNNTISWGKEEIPVLAELNPDVEGIIDFFIKVKEITELDLDKKYQVKSYAQFSIGSFGGEEEGGEGKEETGSEDTRSNTIINKINSDVNLSEKVRYFNEDNIAVGSGPLPPKVGETTIYKIYWVLTNNLHELNNTQVVVNLPDYLKWENKNRASVGTVNYNSQNHQVSWHIGRLPIGVYRLDAEFNIGVTPTGDDANKIMILLPGTIVQAIDSETNAEISKTAPAKTTRLEDDEIAAGLNGDGRVME